LRQFGIGSLHHFLIQLKQRELGAINLHLLAQPSTWSLWALFTACDHQEDGE
jgi:hypothetical protein